MASQPPLPPQGLGRGGRGALVLAALQGQIRRPGETQPDSSNTVSTETKDGAPASGSHEAMLRNLPQAPASAPPTVPAIPLGRGLGRAALLAAVASQGNQPQQPGTQQQQPRPLGRGALLAAGRASALASSIGSSVSSQVFPFSRSSSVSSQGAPSTSAPLSRPNSSASSAVSSQLYGTSRAETPLQGTKPYLPTYPPPVVEMEQLSIGQHSGSMGKKMDLEVNYIKLKVTPGMGVFEYHVSYNPQVDNRDMRFKLLSQPQVKEIIGKVKTFDGAKLYLPLLLPQEVTQVESTHPNNQSVVTITMKYVGQNHGLGRIQLYNVLFRKIMNILKMTLIGRNYFDPSGGIPVPQHKLQIWPGYVQAIQDFEGGLMLNCDVSFRVLRTLTAKDLLFDAYSMSKTNFQDLFLKQVIGCIVLTRYNNKTYRIDDVAWDVTPESTFKTHSGEEISYLKYYKDAYGIDIQDKKQPLLINKPKRKVNEEEDRFICLVPELCSMTGLTDEMRNDFKVMKDIAVHTRVTPNQRQAALKKFCENVNTNPETKQVLLNWGLELDLDTLKINGRLMDPEKIILARNYQFTVGREADWSRDLTRGHVLLAVDLNNWIVLVIKRDEGKAQEFMSTMSKTCPSMGIQVNHPCLQVLDNDRTETYLRAARDKIHPGVQLIVFIFPSARDDRYNAVKKLCCVEMPVPSQVINSRTISQPQKLRSVTQKIALQINCKLGGELWALPIPLKAAMVVGVDTYHDPTRAGLSMLGFVASLNQLFTRWFSITNQQERGQELGDCLKAALLAALRKYDEVNHSLPSHIIFYRDGVGDGQMSHVADYEVKQLESCFQHFSSDYRPKLAVIVVQKKINTKIFLRAGGRGMQDSLENPPPGTVVDHTVTRKEWFDFFLVSQHVRQGTVNPTHYVVVYNQSELKPDHLQKLSYKLTHLYYNWPGTIRVPAPCQYAHKLAYLCGQNIHKEHHVALSDKLFFL